MLPSFDAVLFDFDGTLAIPTLDFADMRRQLDALTAAQGVAVDDFAHLDMLALMEAAMAWLDQQVDGRGSAYYRQAEGLLQDIEIASAQGSGLLPRHSRPAGRLAAARHRHRYCNAQLRAGRAHYVS